MPFKTFFLAIVFLQMNTLGFAQPRNPTLQLTSTPQQQIALLNQIQQAADAKLQTILDSMSGCDWGMRERFLEIRRHLQTETAQINNLVNEGLSPAVISSLVQKLRDVRQSLANSQRTIIENRFWVNASFVVVQNNPSCHAHTAMQAWGELVGPNGAQGTLQEAIGVLEQVCTVVANNNPNACSISQANTTPSYTPVMANDFLPTGSAAL